MSFDSTTYYWLSGRLEIYLFPEYELIELEDSIGWWYEDEDEEESR